MPSGNPNGNPQNLKPWKKGQSGNPRGAPPRRKIEDIFQDFLYETVKTQDGESLQRLDILIKRMYSDAVKRGDVKAIQTLMDRGFGKAKQTIESNVKVQQLGLDKVMEITNAEGQNE